jgi:hypothetical protein
MTAQDMEAMFAPPPYGLVPPPSAFAEAMQPHNAGIWEHFRSVDVDRERRVLEVGEEGGMGVLLRREGRGGRGRARGGCAWRWAWRSGGLC